MELANFYGYCVDGHLHPVKPAYVKMAQTRSKKLDSSLFEPSTIDEKDWSYRKKFLPLQPTNCPNLDSFLPFKPHEPIDERYYLEVPYHPFFRTDPSFELTPIAYVLDFERQKERKKDTKEMATIKLHWLIKETLPKTECDCEELTYETLREAFLKMFWSLEKQESIYEEFMRTRYPMRDEQLPSEFLESWVYKFMNNTYCLSRTIVAQLLRKLPREYDAVIRPHLDGTNWIDLINDVSRFEDENPEIVAKYTTPARNERRNNPGSIWDDCDKVVVGVIVSSISMLILSAFYFRYVMNLNLLDGKKP